MVAVTSYASSGSTSPACTSPSVSDFVVVVMPHLAGSRSRCTTRRRRARRVWLRYSTSITQKRPVPSFVVFGSLTERRIWRVRSTVAGPHRFVEHDRVVAHHRFRQPEHLLQVEVHLQRQRLLGAARRPVVRAEPHREHRRRRDRPAGDLRGDVVVPEQRVAVLDRRARRPDVAALDRELPRLLVLHLADQRLDLGRQRRASLTPPLLPRAAPRSRPPSSRLRAAARRCR